MSDLTQLIVAIAASDQETALALLDATPSLVTAGLARDEECFVAERSAQVYEGDTALHAAAFSYDTAMARELVARGYRARVVTLDRLFSSPDGRLDATETIDGIEIVRIPWSGPSRYPLAPQIFRHLSDADLVHVHAVDFFFDALAWGKPLHGRPMIATTHGGFFHTAKYAALKKIWFQTATRLSALAYNRLISCSTRGIQSIGLPGRLPAAAPH